MSQPHGGVQCQLCRLGWECKWHLHRQKCKAWHQWREVKWVHCMPDPFNACHLAEPHWQVCLMNPHDVSYQYLSASDPKWRHATHCLMSCCVSVPSHELHWIWSNTYVTCADTSSEMNCPWGGLSVDFWTWVHATSLQHKIL